MSLKDTAKSTAKGFAQKLKVVEVDLAVSLICSLHIMNRNASIMNKIDEFEIYVEDT